MLFDSVSCTLILVGNTISVNKSNLSAMNINIVVSRANLPKGKDAKPRV